jgi:hypothetical protein
MEAAVIVESYDVPAESLKGEGNVQSLFLWQAVMHHEFIHKVTVVNRRRFKEVSTGGSLSQGGWP